MWKQVFSNILLTYGEDNGLDDCVRPDLRGSQPNESDRLVIVFFLFKDH